MLRFTTTVVILLVVLTMEGFGREWTDSTGAFRIEAALIKFKPSYIVRVGEKETRFPAKVVLKTFDGRTIEVVVTNLSLSDREFLIKQGYDIPGRLTYDEVFANIRANEGKKIYWTGRFLIYQIAKASDGKTVQEDYLYCLYDKQKHLGGLNVVAGIKPFICRGKDLKRTLSFDLSDGRLCLVAGSVAGTETIETVASNSVWKTQTKYKPDGVSDGLWVRESPSSPTLTHLLSTNEMGTVKVLPLNFDGFRYDVDVKWRVPLLTDVTLDVAP